jgi:hypothetical protein
MNGEIKYSFRGTAWRYESPAGWYFISLPPDLAVEIRSTFGGEEEGWGRLKVKAGIGHAVWKTAIWFDTKRNTYLLPLKAEIRKKEAITTETEIEVFLWR